MDSTKQADWVVGPRSLSLGADEIHVWRVSLDAGDGEHDRTLLNDEEILRADRFIRPIHGRRFSAARATLRILISRYLSMRPDEITFAYNEFGKPSLAPELASHQLKFNLSHSENLALFAFSRGRDLGIDIQHRTANPDLEKMARRFFSPAEVQSLEALPEPERQDAFYRCWTRKEAYIKAKGKGLSISLSSFDVAFAPGDSPALLRVESGDAERARWALYNIDPGGEFAAALMIESQEDSLPPTLFKFTQ